MTISNINYEKTSNAGLYTVVAIGIAVNIIAYGCGVGIADNGKPLRDFRTPQVTPGKVINVMYLDEKGNRVSATPTPLPEFPKPKGHK